MGINFLNLCLESLEFNYDWRCQAYYDNVNELYRKILTTVPVKIPKISN